jgi:D-3-phosphoglycerate dehydrogenase
MDVFPKEPYHGKLIEFDNVVLTPHLATLTKESRLEMEIQATQNLLIELNQ